MKVLPVTSGTSQNGNEWKKQEFVFEYFEQQTDRYSDKVCLSIMNDRIAEYDLHENDEVLIGLHSIREYQGRYFNELRLYKFQKQTYGFIPIGCPTGRSSKSESQKMYFPCFLQPYPEKIPHLPYLPP